MLDNLQAWVYIGDQSYEGVDVLSVSDLERSLKSHFVGINVQLVSADKLRQLAELYKDSHESILKTIVVVFPGGKSSVWDEQLSGTVLKIRDLVRNGARALMVCAGAYFSAESSSFKVGEGKMIERERSLRFFPGGTYGPLYPQPVSVELVDTSGCTTNMLLSCGGYFVPKEGAEEGRDFKVLARYTEGDKEIAIASSTVEKGVAVFSFPHFEFDKFPVDDSSDSSNSCIRTMKEINVSLAQTVAEKATLVSAIFQELNLQT